MLTLLIDQISKSFVEKIFPLGYSREILNHLIYLTHVQNTGGAFSILEGKQFIFIFVSVVLISFLILLLKSRKLSNKSRFAIAFILGGALGNLFDRIFRGYVVDFIDIRIIPVFNIADTCITIGVCILAFELLTNERRGELLQKKDM